VHCWSGCQHLLLLLLQANVLNSAVLNVPPEMKTVLQLLLLQQQTKKNCVTASAAAAAVQAG
jgi:hypothetical protein